MLDLIIDQFVGLAIGSFLTFMFANYKNIITGVKALIMYNKEIRVSVAYLYRIKIDNQYLLIRGSNINQFQPVGGVYKAYSSFQSVMEELQARPEDLKRFYRKSDLRLILKGQKVSKFINWFYKHKNREISVYREFVEEIIDGFDLPIDFLKGIEIEFIKRLTPKISFSKHFKKQELKVFDIYELRLTEENNNVLKDVISKNENLVLLGLDQIKANCFEHNGISMNIGSHTEHIL